jgi:transposase-like protein
MPGLRRRSVMADRESALGLQQVLGFGSYETAWAWLHKLCRAMARPDRERLRGVAEVDETFVGGRHVSKFGAGTDKVPVMVAVERIGAHRCGRVRLAVADAPGTLQLVEFAASAVEQGSTIRTDGARILRRLGDMGYAHEYVASYGSPDLARELPGVHLVSSLLKRWITGTLHYNVSREHLPYYLDEYTFRFNRRASASRGMLFYLLLQRSVATDPHRLTELTRTGGHSADGQ